MAASNGFGDDMDKLYPNLKKINSGGGSSPNASTNYRLISKTDDSNATGSYTPFWNRQ